jgi:hypothetical protein
MVVPVSSMASHQWWPLLASIPTHKQGTCVVMCVSSDSDSMPFRSKDGSALRDRAPATAAGVEVGTVTSRFTTTTTGTASIAETKDAPCPATTVGHISVMAPAGSGGLDCSRRPGTLATARRTAPAGVLVPIATGPRSNRISAQPL